MKKFVSGLITGTIISGIIGAAAVSYTAQPATFKVLVNGKEFNSDPPALVVEGRTYLPLRAIGDALGVPVNWNSELNQAEVGNAPSTIETGYSRTNPAPIGTVQQHHHDLKYMNNDAYTINLKVTSAIRGDEAYKALKEANPFNDEAPEGYEYVLAKIALTVETVENDGAFSCSEFNFKCFSSNNEEMPRVVVVEPEPQFEGKLYAGGNCDAYIAFLVRKDDASPKIAYDIGYDGTGGVWFALQ